LSLKLEEFSDRELLFALEEFSDDEGLATSQAISDGLGFEPIPGTRHPHQSIAVRLGWLRRYGVVHRDKAGWGLTDVGYRLMHGTLRASERRVLDNLDGDRLYAVMQEIGSHMLTTGDEAATMVHRSWRHSMAQRKLSR
jgi:hypothetical protein